MKKIIPLTLSLILSASPLLADSIYDYDKDEFKQKRGGIAEYVLNEFEHTERDITYLKKVDMSEREMQFYSIDLSFPEREVVSEIIGIVRQYESIIEKVKYSEYSHLNDKEKRFKDFLDELDEFRFMKDMVALKNIYESIFEALNKKTVGQSSLDALFDIPSKDHLSPLFYSILSEYEVFVSLRVGTYKTDKGKAMRSWLWMRVDEKEFALDPDKYYEMFAPIETRYPTLKASDDGFT